MKRAAKMFAGLLCALVLVLTGGPAVQTVQAATTVIYEQEGVFSARIRHNPAYITYHTAMVVMDETQHDCVVEIKLPDAGMLDFRLEYADISGEFEKMSCAVYADRDCTERIGSGLSLVYDLQQVRQKDYFIDKPGSVYVRVHSEHSEPVQYILRAGLNRQGDRKLCAGEEEQFLFGEGAETLRLSFSIPKGGVVRFELSGANGTRIHPTLTLYDSKGRALSEAAYRNSEEDGKGIHRTAQEYVLCRGSYELEVTMRGGYSGRYLAGYTYDAARDESGRSIKTAAVLSEKNISGAVTANAKAGSSDWYTFEMEKAGDRTLFLDSRGDGSLMLEVTDRQGKQAWFGSQRIRPGENQMELFDLPKGRYYVRVYKEEKENGLSYSIRYQ